MKNEMYEYFKIVGEINDIINNSKTIDEVLKRTIKQIATSFKIDDVIVWYKDSNNFLHPNYTVSPVDITQKEYKPGEGVVGEVFEKQSAIYLLDYQENRKPDVDEMFKDIKIASLVCAPIANKEGKVGAVEYIKRESKFNEEEASVLEMLTMLAMMKIDDSDKFFDKWVKGETLISIQDAKKDFKNGDFITKVLKGINLEIYKGEFIVLLGESGCGKSTLLNAIGGMDSLTSGSIFFQGKDLSKATNKELTLYRRDHIGFIFQSYNLMPNLNVKENLDLIGELVKNPMDAMEALKLVKLDDKAKNYPSQLSGGQQQRVSIARALVKNPTIIMADEPTAALDYETSIEVLSTLEEVIKKGTTLLMVTHNEEIAKMANRVVRLRNGFVYEITVNRHPLKAQDLVW